MILYHGSYLEVSKPDLKHSRENVDFELGFYTTPLREQAIKWCGKFKRRGKEGIVSHYKSAVCAMKSQICRCVCARNVY